jgi:hypothetical protein
VEPLCNLPVSILTLVRVVAANWSLRIQLKAPEPEHPYTFFSAKTAATFIQFNAYLIRCDFILTRWPRWKRQQ